MVAVVILFLNSKNGGNHGNFAIHILLDCMPTQMRCPKCDYRFSVWEIGAIRTCPKCAITVQVRGWRGVIAVNVAMFIVFGLLMAGAVTHGGALGWGFFVGVLIVWAWAEATAMRALLKVTAVPESSGQ